MKWPKVQISTLMLLVVIAALAIALVVERRQSRQLMIQAEQARAEALIAELSIRRVTSFNSTPPNPIEVYGLDPVVFSDIASKIAADDLGGVPIEEVEADLKAIVEGRTQPIDITEVSAPYVLYRREKKQTRAEAVKSARSDLWLRSAMDVIRASKAK